MDFMEPGARPGKRGTTEIYPSFRTKKSNDLMIRGGEFYAIWDEENKRWSQDQDDVIRMIDNELDIYAEEYKHKNPDAIVKVMHMVRSETKTIDSWVHFVTKQMTDNYVPLDGKIIFSNTETDKKNYSTKKLGYAIGHMETPHYDELMSVLYSPEERHKIEWAIGCVVSGDSVWVQKFLVLIGAPGTGKSTVLDIIRKLFGPYCATIDVRALTNGSAFGLEPLRNNPLVAIEDDANLSRIEDNTRLNSLVSHAKMNVNEKYTKQYDMAYKCFLFLGSNKDVDITDAQSGILRRLIDVEPTGKKVSPSKYRTLVSKIDFELGGIAQHCLDVYNEDPYFYDNYIPIKCFRATNIVYNFVEENLDILTAEDGVTLSEVWKLYGRFCEEANVQYKMNRTRFKTELKAYFRTFLPDGRIESKHARNIFKDFRYEKIGMESAVVEDTVESGWIELYAGIESQFDKQCAKCQAQYTKPDGTPIKKWDNVSGMLETIDTRELHYVRVPTEHIVIDFDLKGADGEKSLELNLREANKWPKTYAEVSKSGKGLHLHYIYAGDAEKLSRIYADGIEIKVFTGASSLRRKLTKCNDIPIATINSGLPIKEEMKKMVNSDSLKNERALRTCIKRNLNKEYHAYTRPSVDFIFKVLEDAYNAGMSYDVSDMRPDVIAFAASSSHQSEYCLSLVSKMKWHSEDCTPHKDRYSDTKENNYRFFDVEVYPNLFLMVYEDDDSDNPTVLYNPTPAELEAVFNDKMIGFNNRGYDNYICYARMMGYDNKQLYELSKKLIANDKNAKFFEANHLSFTDCFDFASAANKKSLKKWEIELNIPHQEMYLSWDKPVHEDLWPKVAEYCCNDVKATKAVFRHLQSDFVARQILADISGGTVNDTTNSLTTKLIFGNNRSPQNEFLYRDLGKPSGKLDTEVEEFLNEVAPEMMEYWSDKGSTLPYFPGYEFVNGKSTYMGYEVGEGGFAWSLPGAYANVALLDIYSQHPHSAIMECLFGPRFTRIFMELVEARGAIKHEEWDKLAELLDGKLTPYAEMVKRGEITSKDLSNALKTAINSVYGLTAARFKNPFRDPRNVDNIVAKRGALFMIGLKKEVENLGYIVVHIKTDSIKIADADQKIIDFVMEYGRRYGYIFENEATYERMCIIDKAQYIARYKGGKHDGEWTATGLKFQIPYVFKTLFTHEDVIFNDLCETKSVKSAMYLDMNEGLPEGEHRMRFVGKVGAFTPIKPGYGGGELLRDAGGGKFSAVTGTKGYRWLESETVKHSTGDRLDQVDLGYFETLAEDAKKEIGKWCPYDIFVDLSEPFETIPF